MRIRKRLILVSALILTSCGLIGNAFTEESAQPIVQQKENIKGKEVCKGKPEYRCKEEMLRLKAENPEEFRKVIKEKKEQIKQRLAELKQADPEKYQRVVKRLKQKCRARLTRLKQQNPQRFKEVITMRQQLFNQHLEELKAQDPGKYQRLMECRKSLQEFKKLKRGNPSKCKGSQKTESCAYEHPIDGQDKQMDKGGFKTNTTE